MIKINNIPLYILAAAPDQAILFDKFLDTSDDSPKHLLEKPPYTRYMGWNMLTLDQAKIRGGAYWEVRNGERKTIQLHRDGSLLAIAYADDSFLGWGQSAEDFIQNPELNALALVEYTYEFVRLFGQMLKYFKVVESVTFRVELRNSRLRNGKSLFLHPSPRGNPLRFLSEGGTVEKDFSFNIQIPLHQKAYDAKYIAFSLIQEVFIRFGITSDKIPLTQTDDKGSRSIDINQFPS